MCYFLYFYVSAMALCTDYQLLLDSSSVQVRLVQLFSRKTHVWLSLLKNYDYVRVTVVHCC